MFSTVGQWVLVDLLNPDHFGLLSIGNSSFEGSSLRKELDPLSREMLIDRIKATTHTGKATRETVTLRGSVWDVLIDPILSPINLAVIGIQAIFDQAGKEFPEKPTIGAIEWMIKDGGDHISTVWDDNMFSLYGITRSTFSSATGDMNQWVGSLIAPEDRARMKVVIDGGIAAPDGKRHIVAYRIMTGAGGSKHLEASGRVFVQRDGPIKWLRSITREVHRLTPAIPPTNVDMSSGGLLHAAFELTVDRVLIAVDMSWFQIFMVSPTWKRSGLQTPRFGYLPHVIHPDDIGDFTKLCEAATAEQRPVSIRLLHTDGHHYPYQVSVSDGHNDPSASSRYIIASLRLLAPEKIHDMAH